MNFEEQIELEKKELELLYWELKELSLKKYEETKEQKWLDHDKKLDEDILRIRTGLEKFKQDYLLTKGDYKLMEINEVPKVDEIKADDIPI